MNSKRDPREIAETLLRRSSCAVQVAAVLSDRHGVFAWGWNSMGSSGYGQHAEMHALERANRERLAGLGATMWVAARRKRNGHMVTARPCAACRERLGYVLKVWWRDKSGEWRLW